MDVTAVDWKKREPRFDVVYHFYSFSKNERIRVKCGAADGEEVPSIAGVFLAANWSERETWDMFGIRFSGHPDLRRILTWEGFNGHPLRKDFPLEGIDTGAADLSRGMAGGRRARRRTIRTARWSRERTRWISRGRARTRAPTLLSPLGRGRDAMSDDEPRSSEHPEVPTLFDVQEMELNFGPQHPSTHGVLRLVLKVDGEKILEAKPDVGYLHRGTEKLFETETYPMGLPHTDRLDYVAAATNNHAFCLTIEKLLDLEVPRRAQLIRVILDELQRLSSHLVWLGTSGHRPRGGDALLVRVPRAGADPRLLRGVLRRAPDPELHADRRASRST